MAYYATTSLDRTLAMGRGLNISFLLGFQEVSGIRARLGEKTASLLGNANLRAVTAEVTQQCPPPMGCRDGLPSGLAADRDRAELEQRAGVTLLAAGAAAVATGVVLLVLNQPRQVLDSSAVTPGVTIQVTPEQLGLGWAHAF